MAVSLELQVGASNTAASANNITFAAIAGRTFYLTGFQVTGLGATGASAIQVTLSGTKGSGTPTWTLNIPAGVTLAISPFPLQVSFGEKGWPGSGQNVAVVVNVPSFGAGNTTANVTAWGYYA